jgi:hypothetical protein
MQADAHFVIGDAHVAAGQPCQDYGLAKVLSQDKAYAVISDGCSTAGNTDVGARLVALATARALELSRYQNPVDIQSFVRRRQQQIFGSSRLALGLSQSDLLATSGYVFVQPSGVHAYIQGDGVVAYRLNDQSLIAIQIAWADSTPAYPAYTQDGFKSFLAYHDHSTGSSLEVTHWNLPIDGEKSEYFRQELPAASGHLGLSFNLPPDVLAIGVFTDGVTQIRDLPWLDAVASLMNFKTVTGSFVKRRLNRFLKEGAKLGRTPVDDLAFAAVSLAPQEDV